MSCTSLVALEAEAWESESEDCARLPHSRSLFQIPTRPRIPCAFASCSHRLLDELVHSIQWWAGLIWCKKGLQGCNSPMCTLSQNGYSEI